MPDRRPPLKAEDLVGMRLPLPVVEVLTRIRPDGEVLAIFVFGRDADGSFYEVGGSHPEWPREEVLRIMLGAS